MTFKLYSRVALAVDLPENGLRRGDLVTIVEYLPANDRHSAGYVVEINDVLGQTLQVVGLLETQIQPLIANALPTMRMPEPAVAA